MSDYMCGMRLFLTACFALLCAPAYAEECLYFTSAGDTLSIDEQDEWVQFNLDGQTFECALGPNGEAFVAYCDFGEVGLIFDDYNAAGSPISALDRKWERKCFEPT